MQMELDSVKLNLRLTAANLQKVFKTCQDFLRSHYLTLVELSKVIALFHPPKGSAAYKNYFKLPSTSADCVSMGKKKLLVNIKNRYKVK